MNTPQAEYDYDVTRTINQAEAVVEEQERRVGERRQRQEPQDGDILFGRSFFVPRGFHGRRYTDY